MVQMDFITSLTDCQDSKVSSLLKRMISDLSQSEIEKELLNIPPVSLLQTLSSMSHRISLFESTQRQTCDTILNKITENVINLLSKADLSAESDLIFQGIMVPLSFCRKICISLVRNLVVNGDIANYFGILSAVVTCLDDDEVSLQARRVLMDIFDTRPQLLKQFLPTINVQEIIKSPQVRISLYEIILQSSSSDASVLQCGLFILKNISVDCLFSEDVLMQQATIQILLEYSTTSPHIGLLLSLLQPLKDAFSLLCTNGLDSYSQRGLIQLCALILGSGLFHQHLHTYINDLLSLVENTKDMLILSSVFDACAFIFQKTEICSLLEGKHGVSLVERLAKVTCRYITITDSHHVDCTVMNMYKNIIEFNQNNEFSCNFFEFVNLNVDLGKTLTCKASGPDENVSLVALGLINMIISERRLAEVVLLHVPFLDYAVKTLLGRCYQYYETKYGVVRKLVDEGYADRFGERKAELIEIYKGGPLYNPDRVSRADLDYEFS